MRRFCSVLLFMLLFCFGLTEQSHAGTTSGYSLVFSKVGNRTNSTDLSGKTVAGNIYVFTTPDTNVSQVKFYVDDPNQSSLPYRIENITPYDLAGGSVTNANPFNTTTLTNGQHSITAKILRTSGVMEVTTANINVLNSIGTSVNRIAVSGPISGQAGKGLSYKATLYDANNKVITNSTCPISFNSGTISGSWSPASPSQPVNGVINTTFTPTEATQGTLIFSCGTTSSQITLNVTPNTVKSLSIEAPSTVQAGVPVQVKVTLYDDYNNIVTNSTNTLQISLSGLTETFNPPSPLSVVNGIGQTNMTVTGPGTTGSLTVTTAAGAVTKSQTITSTPGLVTKIVLTGPTLIKTNEASTFTAKLYDSYNQLASNSTNTIQLSVNGINGTFSPTSTPNPIAGIVNTTFTASTPGNGTATITAASTGSTQSSLTVQVLKNTDAIFGVVDVSNEGQAIPSSFAGFALEYFSFADYLGRTPTALNPIFGQMITNLATFSGPVNIRIGGLSSDKTQWDPDLTRIDPPGITDPITSNERDTMVQFAQQNNITYLMGLNLASNDPQIAVDWAEQVETTFPTNKVLGFMLGNEPDHYSKTVFYTDSTTGLPVYKRPLSYTSDQHIQEFATFVNALRTKFPSIKIVGPVYGNNAGDTWVVSYLDEFLFAEAPDLSLVNFHRYALASCDGPPFKTISDLLDDNASKRPASETVVPVSQAAAEGLKVRVTEGNSVICGDSEGVIGVSDVFASALWGVDYLYELANAGVVGFNFQQTPESVYSPVKFIVTQTSGKNSRGQDILPKTYSYQPDIRPLYYGMMLFAQGTTNQARSLTTNTITTGNVKVWATKDKNGVVRVTVLNKDLNLTGNARIRLSQQRAAGSFIRMSAPSVSSKTGVTLAGQTYDGTLDGKPIGAYTSTPLSPDVNGDYTISLPPTSGVLLSIP